MLEEVLQQRHFNFTPRYTYQERNQQWTCLIQRQVRTKMFQIMRGECMDELGKLRQPWKLFTLPVGIALLIAGSFVY
jgi:hypothetical protein